MKRLPGLYGRRPPSADTNTLISKGDKPQTWGRAMPSSIKMAARRALTWGRSNSPLMKARTIPTHRPVPPKFIPPDTDVSNSMVMPLNTSHRFKKLELVPQLPKIGEAGFYEILKKKVHICKKEFDWHSQDSRDVENRGTVLGYMNEILQFCHSQEVNQLTPEAVGKLLKLVDRHVFRVSLGVPALMTYSEDLLSPEDPARIFNMKCVDLFELLWNTFPNDPRFEAETLLRKLFAQIDRADMTERMKIAMLLSRVCKGNPQLREMITKKLETVFQEYIDGKLLPYGLGPGLQLFMDLSRYRWIQLEDYVRMLLPLLGTKHYFFFHRQFSAITEYYVTVRGRPAANALIKEIIRVFPVTNSSKAVVFVQLLHLAISKVPESALDSLTVTFVAELMRCTCSDFYKLSAVSFKLWPLPGVHQFVRDNTRVLYPLVVPYILDAQESHWCLDIIKKCKTLESLLVVLDSQTFHGVRNESTTHLVRMDELAARDWVTLAQAASRQYGDIVLDDKIAEIQNTFVNHGNPELCSNYQIGVIAKLAKMQRSPSLDIPESWHMRLL